MALRRRVRQIARSGVQVDAVRNPVLAARVDAARSKALGQPTGNTRYAVAQARGARKASVAAGSIRRSNAKSYARQARGANQTAAAQRKNRPRRGSGL